MNSKATILVVDDELGIRQGCRRALEPHGFEVQTISSFKEALEKIGAGHYDLALIDVMMPDGRGVDLLAPLLKNDREIVCVIITGYATVELAVEAIKRGAYGFIAKTIYRGCVLMTVEQGLKSAGFPLRRNEFRRWNFKLPCLSANEEMGAAEPV
jgi:DNA-binding NtrC family response regulator